MKKYVHIKCIGGRLFLTKQSPKNPFITEDDLVHPVPEHVVGNLIRQMCGMIPIQSNIKQLSKRKKMEPYVKVWKELPINQEVEKVASKAFIKYSIPKTQKNREFMMGTKAYLINSHMKGKTKFRIIGKDGKTRTIVCKSNLSWDTFKKLFGKFNVLGIFEKFFNKYVNGFSYERYSLTDTVFELSKHWYDEKYQLDFNTLSNEYSDVFKSHKKRTKVTMYTFEKLFNYGAEMPDNPEVIDTSSITHYNTNSRLLGTAEVVNYITVSAEIVVPFDVDNNLQKRIYEMICEGSGLSKFMGSGYAFIKYVDRITNEDCLDNEGFQKIFEKYELKFTSSKEDT